MSTDTSLITNIVVIEKDTKSNSHHRDFFKSHFFTVSVLFLTRKIPPELKETINVSFLFKIKKSCDS